MDSTLLAAQLLLAVVFSAAGIGKLLDLDGSRGAMEDFGVPARLAGAAGVALPFAELAIAVALLLPASARWGAMGAAALLLAFIGGIANALAHGRAPDCHCFGQIHSATAGRGTLVRNGALALLAGFVAARGPAPAIDSWVRDRTPAELMLAAAGVALVVATTAGLRASARRRAVRRAEQLASQPAGLPAGSPAPVFSLPGACGGTLTLEALMGRGHPILLLFTHPGCGPCAELFREVGRWQTTLAERLTIAVVSLGDRESTRPLCAEQGIADVVVQERAHVYEAYGMRATPSAVLVTPNGVIASEAADGTLTIAELVRLALRGEAQRVA